MIPPTPTPLPEGVPILDLGGTYNLWSGTDAAIHTWRWLGQWGPILQLLILLALIIAAIFIVYRFVQQFTRRDAEV